jgi:hypothetical protein
MTTPDYTSLQWKSHQINTGLTKEPVNYFNPLKLQGDIKLGDFVFNTIDEYGIVWVLQDLEGWWGHPEPQVPDYARGNADGSYDVRGRWNARELTLTGTFIVPDSSYVPLARQRLVDASNLVYRGTWLRVNESNYSKVAWVRLSGRPRIETVNARGRTEFSIGLRAPDPIKYSWNDLDFADGFDVVNLACLNVDTGALGNVLVENKGNTPVPATFRVFGPTTDNAFVQNTTRNELILLTEPIISGSVLDIDTYDNSVALDGEFSGARVMIDPLADWIKLDPGYNSIDFIDFGNFSSTATLQIYFRSGWIG